MWWGRASSTVRLHAHWWLVDRLLTSDLNFPLNLELENVLQPAFAIWWPSERIYALKSSLSSKAQRYGIKSIFTGWLKKQKGLLLMDSSPLHNMFTVAEFFISHPSDTEVRCMAALTDRCLNIGRWRCQGSPRLAGVTQLVVLEHVTVCLCLTFGEWNWF